MESNINNTEFIIISGFLGAGKTTFINQLLKRFYNERAVVVLENEFGKEKIYSSENIHTEEISSGCICCTASIFLRQGLEKCLEYSPDCLLLEPDGKAALPELVPPIIELCKPKGIQLSHLITIIDAKNFTRRLQISGAFVEKQINYSSAVYLSKTELLTDTQTEAVKKQILDIFPECKFIDKDLGNWHELNTVNTDTLKYPVNKITRQIPTKKFTGNGFFVPFFGEEPKN